MGVNSAGLGSKMSTFKKVLSELKPSVFLVEETKFKDAGKLKIDNFLIYELIRENHDTVEALSVEISLKNLKIRCCAAYGCQESDLIERKEKFWKYLEDDVFFAEQSGAGFILHFDGNLWAGSDIVVILTQGGKI